MLDSIFLERLCLPMGHLELRVLNPRGKVSRTPQSLVSPGLGKLTGKKIGILWNGKPMGEVLLPFVEEALKKQLPNTEIRKWIVPISQSDDLKAPKIKEIAEYADGVIALVGD